MAWFWVQLINIKQPTPIYIECGDKRFVIIYLINNDLQLLLRLRLFVLRLFMYIIENDVDNFM